MSRATWLGFTFSYLVPRLRSSAYPSASNLFIYIVSVSFDALGLGLMGISICFSEEATPSREVTDTGVSGQWKRFSFFTFCNLFWCLCFSFYNVVSESAMNHLCRGRRWWGFLGCPQYASPLTRVLHRFSLGSMSGLRFLAEVLQF